MNIAIGKFGKSILFDSKKWKATGGDLSPSVFYITLARYNPDINFYLVGRSDCCRCDKNIIPPNIIDIWEKFEKEKDDDCTYFPIKYFSENNIKIDSGIFIQGPTSSFCMLNKIKSIRNYPKFNTPLSMFLNYNSPITHFLNISQIPYYSVLSDERYGTTGRDLFNKPKFFFSQKNDVYPQRSIKNYEEQHPDTHVYSCIESKYFGFEKVDLIGKQPPIIDHKNKTIDFSIVLNYMATTPDRGKMLDEWILPYFPDINIFGRWPDERMKDKRFKGELKPEELFKKLNKIKFTLLFPLKKGIVTPKFWEMIYHGVIPFIHPGYDTDKNLHIPNYLRVKTPSELIEKIKELKENEAKYLALSKILTSMINNEILSGIKINNDAMKCLFSILGKKHTPAVEQQLGEYRREEDIDITDIFI